METAANTYQVAPVIVCGAVLAVLIISLASVAVAALRLAGRKRDVGAAATPYLSAGAMWESRVLAQEVASLQRDVGALRRSCSPAVKSEG